MRVQGHIEIRNQMIGDASIRSIANMIGGEQVVFVEVQFCSICSCDLLVSPSLWQIILVVAIDDSVGKFCPDKRTRRKKNLLEEYERHEKQFESHPLLEGNADPCLSCFFHSFCSI